MEIGIVEQKRGDLAQIEKNYRRTQATSSPIGWRAIHHHGTFGAESPVNLWLQTAIVRIVASRPAPRAILLPPGMLGTIGEQRTDDSSILITEDPRLMPGKISGYLSLSLPEEEPPLSALEERFEELAARWLCETRYSSSMDDLISHPAYQQIIKMGESVIPLLLHDLGNHRRFWGPALASITGENPVAEEHAGRVKESADDWRKWAKAHGYMR